MKLHTPGMHDLLQGLGFGVRHTLQGYWRPARAKPWNPKCQPPEPRCPETLNSEKPTLSLDQHKKPYSESPEPPNSTTVDPQTPEPPNSRTP